MGVILPLCFFSSQQNFRQSGIFQWPEQLIQICIRVYVHDKAFQIIGVIDCIEHSAVYIRDMEEGRQVLYMFRKERS